MHVYVCPSMGMLGGTRRRVGGFGGGIGGGGYGSIEDAYTLDRAPKQVPAPAFRAMRCVCCAAPSCRLNFDRCTSGPLVLLMRMLWTGWKAIFRRPCRIDSNHYLSSVENAFFDACTMRSSI